MSDIPERVTSDFAALCEQEANLPAITKLRNALVRIRPTQRPIWLYLLVAWLADHGIKTFRPAAQSILQEIPQTASSRRDAVEITLKAASLHDGFRRLVAHADAMRNAKQLHDAEDAYASALKLFPFHGNYRVQLAHMLKDQGKYTESFVQYCFALGSGAPKYDVEEHLRFVTEKLQVNFGEVNVRNLVNSWDRAKLSCDNWDAPPLEIDFRWFARLFWGDEGVITPAFMQSYLVKCTTRKALFLSLLRAPETLRHNRAFFVMSKEKGANV